MGVEDVKYGLPSTEASLHSYSGAHIYSPDSFKLLGDNRSL